MDHTSQHRLPEETPDLLCRLPQYFHLDSDSDETSPVVRQLHRRTSHTLGSARRIPAVLLLGQASLSPLPVLCIACACRPGTVDHSTFREVAALRPSAGYLNPRES